MTNCPLCTHPVATAFLQRPAVPVHQNVVLRTPAAARAVARGDLQMACCAACGFVFNRAFEPGLPGYGAEYDNAQHCSPTFSAYLDGLVDSIVDGHGVREGCVVEVGCGQGQFLHRLIAHPRSRLHGVGFDPSYVGPPQAAGGRLHFHPRYYDADCASLKADAVVCRHVIEHVPDPLRLILAVREALAGSPGARVFFETPCVGWILEHRVLWDFFYEHCSLFTAASLAWAFERCGFRVEAVHAVFGGQYLWLEAVVAGEPRAAPPPLPDGRAVEAAAGAWAAAEQRMRAHWLARLEALGQRGRVALWGAGAKGVTFANLIDPDGRCIDCIVDINPNKQGGYVAASAHPIVDYRALPARGVRSAVLMNPNYREENLRQLTAAGVAVDLVDFGDSE